MCALNSLCKVRVLRGCEQGTICSRSEINWIESLLLFYQSSAAQSGASEAPSKASSIRSALYNLWAHAFLLYICNVENFSDHGGFQGAEGSGRRLEVALGSEWVLGLCLICCISSLIRAMHRFSGGHEQSVQVQCYKKQNCSQ